VVYREVCTEGSGTAKSGTDEQERHKRLFEKGKQTHHCNAHFANFQIVDVAGIGGKDMLLPGEVSVTTCWIGRSQQKP
jgi:hypothetical protein